MIFCSVGLLPILQILSFPTELHRQFGDTTRVGTIWVCAGHRQETVEPAHVLNAIALTLEWFADHPECVVAAWQASGIVRSEWYYVQGLGDLWERAEQLQKGEGGAFVELKEYMLESRLWNLNAVAMDQAVACLESSISKGTMKNMELPEWLRENEAPADGAEVPASVKAKRKAAERSKSNSAKPRVSAVSLQKERIRTLLKKVKVSFIKKKQAERDAVERKIRAEYFAAAKDSEARRNTLPPLSGVRLGGLGSPSSWANAAERWCVV